MSNNVMNAHINGSLIDNGNGKGEFFNFLNMAVNLSNDDDESPDRMDTLQSIDTNETRKIGFP
jgi:hypothetical protein